MQTTVESLDGNKVKLHVAVPASEFERAIDAAFKKLAGEVRIPGFRPGKAPRRLLEARFGTEAARDQALRDSLPEYYVEAVTQNDVDPIAPPEIEITAGEESGDVEFDAVVEVRPIVNLVGYDELRVEVPWEAVDDAAVDQQVDALRDRFADLVDSEDPLIDDAYATIDITGSIDGEPVEGLTATDFLYRVGGGMIVDELDDQLRGTRPGAILEFDSTLPDRFGDNAGETVTFRVVVKDTKRKVLPDLTDEWASEASEVDTVDELRDDIRKRLEVVQKLQAQMAVRDKVLEAAAELVPIEPPEALIENETRGRLQDLDHRLRHQGSNLADYVAATGQEPEAFLEELKGVSARAVLADLALRAVVTQEAIEASDEELDEEVARLAERMGQKVDRVRRDLEKQGALEAVRSDIARGKALQFLVDHSTVVDENGEVLDLALPTTDGAASADPTLDNDDAGAASSDAANAENAVPENGPEERSEA
jgi:trigger factor